MKGTVEIFCDGNPRAGYGHIRRSRTLAERLERDGIEARVVGLSNTASAMLPSPRRLSEEPKIAVFDSFQDISHSIEAAHRLGQTTVTLDWFGPVLPDVNIAVFAHSEVRANKSAYTGFEFILIREEIASQRRQLSKSENRRVLVFIGGGDLLSQAIPVAVRLRNFGYQVTVVQGPLAKKSGNAEGYEVLVDPPHLPSLLASCDWAVTNGGGCYFEAMCLGKASLVLPQTASELKIALYGQSLGAALGIGQDALRPFSPEEIEPIATRSAEIVDGRGAERVSRIIREQL